MPTVTRHGNLALEFHIGKFWLRCIIAVGGHWKWYNLNRFSWR